MIQAKTIKPGTYCALYHFSSNKQIINGLFQEGVKKGGRHILGYYHFYQLFDKVCWLDVGNSIVFVINNSIWPERLMDLREITNHQLNCFLVWRLLYFGTQAELVCTWLVCTRNWGRWVPKTFLCSAVKDNLPFALLQMRGFNCFPVSAQ